MEEQGNAILIAENTPVQILQRQTSKQFLQKIEQKVAEQLINGSLQLSNNQDDYDNFINHHKKQTALKQLRSSNHQRQINSQNQHIQQKEIADQYQNKTHKEYIITPRLYPIVSNTLKKQQILKQIQTEEEVKRQFVQKMKNWNLQKMKIQKQKQQIEAKKNMIKNQKIQQSIRQQQFIQKVKKEQKKKMIQAKLQEIEQRRIQRLQLLKNSSVKRSQSVPKFIQYQNKFKQSQKMQQIQSRIILQNKRQALQSNLHKIKEHQKAYIERIKQRLNMKSVNRNKPDKQSVKISKQDNFNIYKKNASQIKKIQEKIKKIKKFQLKVGLIPLKIDQQKRKQIQIKGDKLKNFKKYHFLSQKALSDQLIYEQFKDFDLNINQKQLGNKYFEQIKQYNKKNSRRKVSSQQIFPTIKPQYKNYLPELRQINKLTKERSKSLGAQNLMKQSQQYELKAYESINQLKNISSYHESLKKEEEMDSNYMKAIQAKLQLAKK